MNPRPSLNRTRSCVLQVVLAVLSGVLAVSEVRASASDTQWWTANTAADHVRAETRGIVVGADGVLRAGPRTASFPIDSLTVAWCAVVLRDGSLAVGGDRGRLMRWSEKSGWRVWARFGSGQVLSLAADGDGVVAGTGPRGLVYRVAANGDTTRLASTGERYVWGLAKAGKGAWFAATGTHGKLVRISDGKVSVLLDTEESNLVSLIADGKGGVYAGGDSRGRVYQLAADGRARTLFDAGEDEVRALALDPSGAVWAAALSTSAATDDVVGEDGPQPVKSVVGGGRAVLYRVSPEGDASAWWTSPQPLVYGLAIFNGKPWASTGNRAGVHAIERSNAGSLLLAPAQGQVTALVAGAKGECWALASNPAVLWRLGPGETDDGELISSVHDARRFARFGRVRSSGKGRYTISTRTGNSDTPDTTWSRWQATGDEGAIASPAARFAQWKLRLGSSDARVDEVSVSYRESNQPPRIEDLSVAPQGRNFREGEATARSEAVTQTLAGGQKVEYSALVGGSRSLREMPLWARGLRTLSWRGVDPNGDALRYRIAVRAEEQGEWIEIGKDIETSSLTWNTNTLSDGRYRVRVTASDREGNAVGEELSTEAVSEPFSIDNTPPKVTELDARAELGAVSVRGRAQDGEGWLQRLDLSTDDGPWRAVSPEGGFSDAPRLGFHVQVKELAPGPHLVSVRAVDAAGNSATAAVRVTVPKPR